MHYDFWMCLLIALVGGLIVTMHFVHVGDVRDKAFRAGYAQAQKENSIRDEAKKQCMQHPAAPFDAAMIAIQGRPVKPYRG